MEAQRKLLDSLMGKDRNGDTKISAKRFTDSDVCKNYLCGLCPNDLFGNTKMDDGECRYKHSDVLRQDYEAAIKNDGDTFPFERELMGSLQKIVQDCDRKIERAQQRIQNTPGDKETANMAATIQALYQRAQELGEEGKIKESEEILQKAEELRQNDKQESNSQQTQQEKLRVCETCSAFLSMYDSNRRLADHFGGKLHIGYLQIRDRLKELKEKYPTGSHRSYSSNHRGSREPERRRNYSPDRRYKRDPPHYRDRDRDYSRDHRGGRDRDFDHPPRRRE